MCKIYQFPDIKRPTSMAVSPLELPRDTRREIELEHEVLELQNALAVLGRELVRARGEAVMVGVTGIEPVTSRV